jgi:hypothetical protein
MRELYHLAKESANSWNQKDAIKDLAIREAQFVKLAVASNAEQWQVNVAVHYNSWDNLGREDFGPVVKAFRDLLGAFTCSECGDYLRVSPDRETAQSVHCECGKTNFNLQKKKA